MNFKDFVKERNEALRSLDKAKIIAYSKKYDVPVPADERTMWAGIHKARLMVTSMTEEEKQISRDWLKENGFQGPIGHEDI